MEAPELKIVLMVRPIRAAIRAKIQAEPRVSADIRPEMDYRIIQGACGRKARRRPVEPLEAETGRQHSAKWRALLGR